MTLLSALFAFLVAILITRWLLNPQHRLHILDHPNTRSLHTVPVPRSGGLAVLAALLASGIMVIWMYGATEVLGWVAGGMLLIAVVSFVDDCRHIPAPLRFAVHILAALALLEGGLGLAWLQLPGQAIALGEAVSTILSLLFVVWMINLYNFMDGMDGFAGGMAVMGFGSFALLGWLAGDGLFLALNLLVCAAAAGFTVFNFPPARIFMGDAGASSLGFLAAAFSLWADREGLFPLWVAMLVFSPFVVDATLTLLRRLWRRERIWEAHRSHYYQRLVQAGWGHRRTVLAEYGLMATASLSAVLALQWPIVWQWCLLGGWLLCYAGLVHYVHRREARQGSRAA